MTFLLGAQGTVGSWQDHLSYSTSHYLTGGGDNVYSSAGASLLVRDNAAGTVSSLSRISGLNETLIGAVAWCEEEQTLIIVYKNTGVDLVRKGVITNIPDIKNKYIPGLKEIYSATVTGDLALLSGSFGIVVINVAGRYVADTWKPGPDGDNNEVYETAIINDQIFAATARGVYFAPLTRTGLSYFDNWEMLGGLPSPDSKFNGIAAAGSVLFISKPGASTVLRFAVPYHPGPECCTYIHRSRRINEIS